MVLTQTVLQCLARLPASLTRKEETPARNQRDVPVVKMRSVVINALNQVGDSMTSVIILTTPLQCPARKTLTVSQKDLMLCARR